MKYQFFIFGLALSPTLLRAQSDSTFWKIFNGAGIGLHSPKVEKVIVDVCVDRSGNVILAEYKKQGSTTTDPVLLEKAIKAAKQYRFAPSESEVQCGTIAFKLEVKPK
jgi:hypothetical protein